MSVQTGLKIITRTMRGLGYLNRNTDPQPNEAEDALDTLNEMLAGWNREKMLLPYVLIQSIALVANQSLYTVGAGGDVNITRPDKINYVSVRLGSTVATYVEIPVRVLNNEREFQLIRAKGIATTLVSHAWYNPKFPLGELNCYPVPSATGTLLIYVQDRLTAMTLNGTVSLPDGLLQAIRFNLGVRLQPELQVELPKGWLEQAKETKGAIKSSNIKHGLLELDVPGINGRYWIQSDSYR